MLCPVLCRISSYACQVAQLAQTGCLYGSMSAPRKGCRAPLQLSLLQILQLQLYVPALTVSCTGPTSYVTWCQPVISFRKAFMLTRSCSTCKRQLVQTDSEAAHMSDCLTVFHLALPPQQTHSNTFASAGFDGE